MSPEEMFRQETPEEVRLREHRGDEQAAACETHRWMLSIEEGHASVFCGHCHYTPYEDPCELSMDGSIEVTINATWHEYTRHNEPPDWDHWVEITGVVS